MERIDTTEAEILALRIENQRLRQQLAEARALLEIYWSLQPEL